MKHKPNASGSDKEWKQAINICVNIEGLDHDEALSYVSSLTLNNSVRSKVSSILSRMNEERSILDSGGLTTVINKINAINPDIVGKTIDSYKIIKLLDKGGMSSVFLAENIQAGIKKPVALKVLSPYVFSDKSVELFKREQLILSKLEHPNIVSFHHSGKTDDGTNYLVMEYIDAAMSITDYCKNNSFNTKQIVQLVLKAAKVFAYSHSNLIIHRDIKPSNLLIDKRGTLKVIDFGIGQLTYRSGNTSTQVFTLDSASPEQILGKNVNIQTDVFSLGAILLQLLLGKEPLPKTTVANYNPQDDVKYINKLLKESELDTDLKNIIQTAMHIDTHQRYRDMTLFAKDLDNYLQYKPVAASSDSIFYRTQKILARNPLTSSLVAIVMVVFLLAMITINSHIAKRQQAENKNTSSLAIIDALFEQADPFKTGKNSQELVKTLERIEQDKQDVLTSDKEFSYHFYEKMTVVYNQNGHYNKALTAKRKQINTLKAYAKPDNLLLFEKQSEELSLLHATGDYAQTINKAKALLKELANNPQLDPVLTLKTYNTLSKCYIALNKLNDAMNAEKQALQYMDDLPEINPGFKADMLGGMAISQFLNNNQAMSDELFDRTISLNRSLPNRKKQLIANLRNYAAANVNYGDFNKAEKLFLESINTIKSIDAEHPNLASVYLRYSSLLAKTNRLNQAKEVLQTAVDILLNTGDDVDLFMAYQYLANMTLRENKLKATFANILLANKFMQRQYSLDTAKMIGKFNLGLWALMIEPYQDYAKEVISFLDKTNYINSKNSKEYEIYQVQKALLENVAIYNKQKISLLSQFLYSDELDTDNKKIAWLQKEIKLANESTKNYPLLVKAFLNLWLLEFNADITVYNTYCQNSTGWINAQQLALKVDLIKQCIYIAKKNIYGIPAVFISILADLERQTNKNKLAAKEFVEELTN
ncbi:hypothetical protein MNBD_GAMMA03-890 [hydrothermal vent metagenome]|uniref:Protein kinase domain-containing protein n=1 Tax=hydrothermal vent metagenome TaxID=652676 RepID=A0A3B0WIW8_9ZZZZ